MAEKRNKVRKATPQTDHRKKSQGDDQGSGATGSTLALQTQRKQQSSTKVPRGATLEPIVEISSPMGSKQDLDPDSGSEASKPGYEAQEFDQDKRREGVYSPTTEPDTESEGEDINRVDLQDPHFLQAERDSFPRIKAFLPSDSEADYDDDDDDDDELLDRWATYPALRSVKNLRTLVRPNESIKVKDRMKDQDDLHEYQDSFYNPEELYNRLDRMRNDSGGRNGEGYTIEEIIGYREDENEKERVEWILWTVGAIFVVLIAVVITALGLGWRPLSVCGQTSHESPQHTNAPRNIPQAPQRLQVAPSNFTGMKGIVSNVFRAAGILDKMFATAGLRSFTKKVAEKTSWGDGKNGGWKELVLGFGAKKKKQGLW
ncbi:hypothetical protein TWF718_003066 [Orbilia javanica]|uniref:Uncharacterized protein n=1 Tax=Orbilia javanica TaxID=47235 RepID=A0AAN8NLC7_9PEZI